MEKKELTREELESIISDNEKKYIQEIEKLHEAVQILTKEVRSHEKMKRRHSYGMQGQHLSDSFKKLVGAFGMDLPTTEPSSGEKDFFYIKVDNRERKSISKFFSKASVVNKILPV